jgi:HK97 family phage portal protein
LNVYQRVGDDERRVAREHPVYHVVHRRPNPDMTPLVYSAQQSAYELLWGNSFAYIEPLADGSPGALWPLPAWGVAMGRFPDRTLAYDISAIPDRPTTKDVLGAHEVLHVPNIVAPDRAAKLPGVTGRSVISYARESLGEQLAAQKFGGGFFAGGSMFASAVKVPGSLKKAGAKERLREGFAKVHGTPKRALIVLDEGAELDYGLPLKDLQFLELRQFSVAEIARWFAGVPNHLLNDLSHATFSNIVEQNLDFLRRLLPLLTLTAQELSWKLFDDAERLTYYVEHILEHLLRADPHTRATIHSLGLKDGWLDRDEVRRLENRNSMGPAGKIKTINPGVENIDRLLEKDEEPDDEKPIAGFAGNGDEEDEEEEQEGTEGTEEEESRDSRLPTPNSDGRSAALLALTDELGRLVHKQGIEARHAAMVPKKFCLWNDKYHADFFHKATRRLTPAVDTCRAMGIDVEAEDFALRLCQESHRSLLEVAGQATAAELLAAVEALAAEWEKTRVAAMIEGLARVEGLGSRV